MDRPVHATATPGVGGRLGRSRTAGGVTTTLAAALLLAGCSGGSTGSAPVATPPPARASADVTASPVALARSTTAAAPFADAALWVYRVGPALAADDADGLLVATEVAGRRDTRSVVAAFRAASGRWAPPTVLARRSDQATPTVAAGGHGRAAVAWTTYGTRAMTEAVRIRDPRGRWSAAHLLARDADFTLLAGLDMNRRGDVAALAQSGESFRVVSRVAGRWTTTRALDCVQGNLALDDRGVSHVACIGAADRGAEGRATVWTKRPGGPLSRERSLGRASELTVQVAPDGRETILLGVGTPGSTTSGGQIVYAGAYRVLRQATRGGALRRAWSRATVGPVLVSTAGRRLQVAWQQAPVRVPQGTVSPPSAVQTQALLPVRGPVRSVARRTPTASGRPDAGFDLDLAVPASGPGALVWRAWRGSTQNRADSPRLTPLVATGTRPAVGLPGASRDVADQFLTGRSQLAVTSTGRVWVAWVRDAVTAPDPAGDRVTTDGTVEVAMLAR